MFNLGLNVFIAFCTAVGTWVAVFGVPKWSGFSGQAVMTPWWAWAILGTGAILFITQFILRITSRKRLSKDEPKVMRELSPIELRFPNTDWDKPLEIVYGKEFRNEVVLAEGRHFVKCKFENVSFLYNGKRHVPTLTDCAIGPIDMDGAVAVEFRTENPVIADTIQFLQHLGITKAPKDYRLIQGVSE